MTASFYARIVIMNDTKKHFGGYTVYNTNTQKFIYIDIYKIHEEEKPQEWWLDKKGADESLEHLPEESKKFLKVMKLYHTVEECSESD